MKNERLIQLAQELQPEEPDLAACWDLVIRGLEVGWLGIDGLDKLLDYLPCGNDYGVEELLFDILGDDLQVSFLDEDLYCSPEDMIRQLQKLRQSYRSD